MLSPGAALQGSGDEASDHLAPIGSGRSHDEDHRSLLPGNGILNRPVPGSKRPMKLPFIPQNRHGETLCLIVACWAGPLERGEKELEPIRKAGPIAAQLVTPMPFPALNSAFDALLPPGLQHYWKASFATKISDGAIAAHLQHGPKVPVVNSTMHIYPINGACNRVKADATAFAFRERVL